MYAHANCLQTAGRISHFRYVLGILTLTLNEYDSNIVDEIPGLSWKMFQSNV